MEWSTNPIKLARAKGKLGSTATEEELKAEYIKTGGRIAPGFKVAEEVSTPDQLVVVIAETSPKPKKVKKVVKKKK